MIIKLVESYEDPRSLEEDLVQEVTDYDPSYDPDNDFNFVTGSYSDDDLEKEEEFDDSDNGPKYATRGQYFDYEGDEYNLDVAMGGQVTFKHPDLSGHPEVTAQIWHAFRDSGDPNNPDNKDYYFVLFLKNHGEFDVHSVHDTESEAGEELAELAPDFEYTLSDETGEEELPVAKADLDDEDVEGEADKIKKDQEEKEIEDEFDALINKKDDRFDDIDFDFSTDEDKEQ